MPIRLVLAALALWLLGACAAPQTARLLESNASALPRFAQVGGVPFYAQTDNYCGPAALAMAATWAGVPLTQERAGEMVFTPGKEGTLRNDVVAAARRLGLMAVELDDVSSLLAEVAAGHPVIVFQNLGLSWVPRWHYSVVLAYDLDHQTIVQHSGITPDRATDLNAFERTWARGDYWAVVLVPAGELPAAGRETALLEAALGLERLHNYNPATKGYKSILKKFPSNTPAWMGLGNSEYARADFVAAAEAFERAATVAPGDPAAWNNLAYAYAAAGRNRDARRAAERAVAAATPATVGAYQDTLREMAALPID